MLQVVFHKGQFLDQRCFLLFISDVCDIFGDLNVMCKLYADDLKLYTTHNLSETHVDLLAAIHRLLSWADMWQLKLAPQKCSVCRFQNPKWQIPRNYSFPTYKVDDYTLPVSDTIHALGVIVDSKLKFDKHISAITHKAHARANLILRCFSSRDRTLLQSPAIAEDCYILVVLFFYFFKFFSVHQIFDVPGPIFAKLCHTTRYVLK